jgi:uncharacterized membrane protein
MQEPKHHRHDFMIERIAFFSDAVFAIAITLMIIEIHPPLIEKGDTEAIAWHKFQEKLPEFLGLLVSFMLIGGTWLRHHTLFKYADKYDRRFILLNLVLLFTIILFPFSTSFLFNSIFHGAVTRLQIYFYLGVPFLSTLVLYIMYRDVHNNHIGRIADNGFKVSLFSHKAMILSFALTILWIIFVPLKNHYWGYFLLYIGPAMIMNYRRKLKKNAKPQVAAAD